MTASLDPDVVDALDAGLRWLFDTEQPDNALAPFAASLDAAERHLTFNPAWHPIGQPARPRIWLSTWPITELSDRELVAFKRALAARVPVHSTPARDGWLLARDAHPSLLAAVGRHYDPGCPEHGNRQCELRDDCPWRPEGRAALRPPAVVGRPVQLALFAA
ncbi:hypothetical protein [Pseudonocardia sp.]|uniref:hypothetical protein n=1 Tax=Pseudonocardia sp. TaxID=60912 RepID=UPI003D1339AD